MQPEIVWAQRKNIVLITIRVHDAINPEIKLADNTFTFKGKSADQQNSFDLTLELYGEVDAKDELSKYVIRPRGIDIALKKKDESVWWPRLAKTTKKLHYISVDWNRWVDEDEEDEKPAYPDFGMDGMNFNNDDDDDDDDEMDDVTPAVEENADATPDAEATPAEEVVNTDPVD